MSADDASEWFATCPSNQKTALDALRNLILATGDGIVEEIKWGRPCYSTKRVLFCYLHNAKSHVTIGFQRGSTLRDPEGLLEGTGKSMRHVKLNGVDHLREKHAAITALLKQAFET